MIDTYFKTLTTDKPEMAVAEYPCQARFHKLIDLLKIGIMPWQWDVKYSQDMIGFFYNEDIENIRTAKRMGLL